MIEARAFSEITVYTKDKVRHQPEIHSDLTCILKKAN